MTAIRNGLGPLALSLFVAMAPCAYAQAQADTKPVVESPSKAEKVRVAREKHEWTVEKGESLLRICRLLSDDPATRQSLSVAMLEDNPEAFIEGDRTRIKIGARLRLRGNLVLPISRDLAEPVSQSAPLVASVPATSGAESIAADSPSSSRPPPASNGRAHGTRNGRRNGNANGITAPAAPAYLDQLIEGLSEEREIESATRRDAEPGRRVFSAEYRAEIRQPDKGGKNTSKASICSIDLRP